MMAVVSRKAAEQGESNNRSSSEQTTTTTIKIRDFRVEQQSWKQQTTIKPTAVFHSPPPPPSQSVDDNDQDDDYYKDNQTPFGAILRGELPAVVFCESDTLFSFQDRTPRADFHALIISKREIGSILDLSAADLPMLYAMKNMADDLLLLDQDEQQDQDDDYKLVFHVPPFTSVPHLHLHVLAPVESMGCFARLKYWSETPWCTSWDSVVARLEQTAAIRIIR
jgi:diadenosine tetraphosphate (Ap4A) HIT family hydrolase